jgi:hypothetical protein
MSFLPKAWLARILLPAGVHIMQSARLVLPFAALSLLLNGCVSNRIYRPGTASEQTAPVVSTGAAPSNFKLGIIEFDDMGESWEKCTSLTDPSNCQLSRVLNLIREEKKSGDVEQRLIRSLRPPSTVKPEYSALIFPTRVLPIHDRPDYHVMQTMPGAPVTIWRIYPRLMRGFTPALAFPLIRLH